MSSDTNTSSSSGVVSIHLTDEPAGEAEYDEITYVRADIFLQSNNSGTHPAEKKAKKQVGFIEASIIDRKLIPARHFYGAFDAHSASLQAIGCALLEPRYGRTKLESLAEWDDPKFDFMIIDKFHMDDAYKPSASSSDVAAMALRQFLHHPFIKGSLRHGDWRVSSAAYELDPREAMSPTERQEYEKFEVENQHLDVQKMLGMKSANDDVEQAYKAESRRWEERFADLGRIDAIPFLRNGFFQDPALAKAGSESYLVGGYGHFREPLKSDAQVAAIQFVPRSELPHEGETPTGKDEELFELVKQCCDGSGDLTRRERAIVRTQVQRLLQSGASVSRSHGLHAACSNNVFNLIDLLLDLEPAAINAFDACNSTPLMMAAMDAAGRNTKNGISETRVIDLLLERGADKDLQDPHTGLTAYGRFLEKRKEYSTMMQALTLRAVQTLPPTPSEQAVMDKLFPSNGPSPADLTGGRQNGFVDYTQEDRECESDEDGDW